jgi:universal stress protein F
LIAHGPSTARLINLDAMNRILVALDASERAGGVLAYATELARRTGGKLILFRAVAIPVDLPIQAFTMAPSELAPTLLEQAAEALRKLASNVPADMLDRVETDVGPAWQAVCNAGQRLNTDLIVIGSHGYGALDRLLGTTAAKIVNHAPCPVLVVRHGESHPV